MAFEFKNKNGDLTLAGLLALTIGSLGLTLIAAIGIVAILAFAFGAFVGD
ncbi:MAG TPA: hypothetical protein VFU31_21865 [Candidatus Binatia bacterium]|nr:hypothetical protein [Candidatus Binatia bacterium]